MGLSDRLKKFQGGSGSPTVTPSRSSAKPGKVSLSIIMSFSF